MQAAYDRRNGRRRLGAIRPRCHFFALIRRLASAVGSGEFCMSSPMASTSSPTTVCVPSVRPGHVAARSRAASTPKPAPFGRTASQVPGKSSATIRPQPAGEYLNQLPYLRASAASPMRRERVTRPTSAARLPRGHLKPVPSLRISHDRASSHRGSGCAGSSAVTALEIDERMPSSIVGRMGGSLVRSKSWCGFWLDVGWLKPGHRPMEFGAQEFHFGRCRTRSEANALPSGHRPAQNTIDTRSGQ
jgi:hypothetical protein